MTEKELMDLFNRRLVQLRMQKNLSAREMSLQLGRSECLICPVVIGQALPSLGFFFLGCVFLGIHPKDFFDEEITEPFWLDELYKEIRDLNPVQAKYLLELLKELKRGEGVGAAQKS